MKRTQNIFERTPERKKVEFKTVLQGKRNRPTTNQFQTNRVFEKKKKKKMSNENVKLFLL